MGAPLGSFPVVLPPARHDAAVAEAIRAAVTKAHAEGYDEGFAAGAKRASQLILRARQEALRDTADAFTKAILQTAIELRRELDPLTIRRPR